jgi:condensin complex subunit 1
MCFRFPNLLEPWSSHLYSRLRDPCISVRKQCLMVLCHLTLNDMLKAKGPVAEVAKCLRDPHPSIAELARLFFTELNKKGKDPIYNMLPDIISRLSRDNNVCRTRSLSLSLSFSLDSAVRFLELLLI